MMMELPQIPILQTKLPNRELTTMLPANNSPPLEESRPELTKKPVLDMLITRRDKSNSIT